MTTTPWGALWGDPADTRLLDQVLANALGLELIVGAPVAVCVDADDGPDGSGLAWTDVSFDGGTTWTEVGVEELPATFELVDQGPIGSAHQG